MIKACCKKFKIELFNAILRHNFFPTAWKSSRVVIIPKGGRRDPSSASSYRPISISSVISKLFESILNRRIQHLAFISKFDDEEMCAYIEGRSAETGIHKLHQIMTNARGVLMAIDLEGAFDRLNHISAIHGLVEMCCPDYIIQTVTSMMKNRKVTIEHLGVRKSRLLPSH